MRNLVYSFIAVIALVVVGCGHKVNDADLQLLNGYWEIEKVKLPDGEEKDYTVNTTLDYLEINAQGEGFRQKVMPQFNGEYETNDIPETLVIKKDGDTFWMEYSTDFAKWKEQLISIEKGKMVVKNAHDITYYYKEAIPFSKK